MGCVVLKDGGILCLRGEFKVGDPRPKGYLDVDEWMSVQHAGGLRQTQCPKCGLWRYPQEVCDHADSSDG